MTGGRNTTSATSTPNNRAGKLDDAQRHTLRSLVQHVGRAFYDVEQVVALDQLAKHDVLKDEDLAGRIGANSKETSKRLASLVNARLVSCHSQNEQKDPTTNRSSVRKYYYIDYPQFCNLVKWGIAEMRRNIDDKLRNELANKGYVCPRCRTNFSMLDADRLLDPARGSLFCDQCGTEVVNNVESEDANNGRQDRMQRFNAATEWIRALLKKIDDMVLPVFDVQDWVRKNAIASHAAALAASSANGTSSGPGTVGGQSVSDGLAIAGAHGTNAPQVQKVSVEIIDEKDSEARRKALELEAQSKRQQNALPSWHTHSTISGHATSLGLSDPSSSALPPGTMSLFTMADEGETNEEVKPDVLKDQRADYYARYYAELQEKHARETTNDTADNNYGSDYDEDNGFAATSNTSRKRGRGPDDEGDEENGAAIEGESIGADIKVGGGTGSGVIVYVNGAPMDVNDVTDDHHEQMTPDEYEAYFQALGAM